MGNCSSCVYARYPKIPASVPKKARIAIVGEAPGPMELARKQPFIGPSGELVRNTFSKLKIPMEDVFVTNSLLCKPPSGKPIRKEAVDCCRARLLGELAIVQPDIVVAFGNTSMHALTGNYKKKITSEQGRSLPEHLLPGSTIVVPVFHPAAILRDGGKLPQFTHALSRVAMAYEGRTIEPPPEPSYTVVTTPEQIEKARAGLVKQSYLAADIETSGDATDPGGRILCLGICWKPGKVLIFPEEVWPQIKDVLEHPHPKWIWQGGKYDISWFHERGISARLDEDLMMAHYSLNENPGTHDLEQLAAYYLGDNPWKHVVDAYAGSDKKHGYAKVPKDVLYKYLALDCDRTYRTFGVVYRLMQKDPELVKLYYNLLLPASRFLSEVQNSGMRPDPLRLKELGDELLKQIEVAKAGVQEAVVGIWNPERYRVDTGAKKAPDKFNPGSPKQLGWLLYDKLGLRPKKQKKKGVQGRSTDIEVLKTLIGQHEVVELVLAFRSVVKAYGTYVKGIIKRTVPATGRVHPTFNVHGTVTGRLSCTDPNVQNVPKPMRRVYVAPPGYTYVELDYSGAELRVLAHISGDKFMSDVFEQGRDLHTEVQNALNIPRIRAKTINFGIPYGRGAASIAQAFGIPLSEAQKMVDDWFERAPDVLRYLEGCDEAARTGQVLTTPLGRKRRFGLVSLENFEDVRKEARNFRIQSIASDMTLLSAIELESWLKARGAYIVNLVHDSILIECPDALVVEVATRAVEVMKATPRNVLQSKIPFEAEIKVGKCWGELKVLEL